MKIELKDIRLIYKTGNLKNVGLKDYIIDSLRHQNNRSEFLAIDGVSFSVSDGDFLGIIGGNGAGKSTLLKVITGIMQPTAGSVHVEGNVAALLELGSGFDGEMTVRENIFLRGAILGYDNAFLTSKYDDIIEFSGLEDFQNTPFRQLSSGMKSRLAFSIASMVNPEILILDEVLSVGDDAFRKKSEQKMLSIINSGVTTILVSHSLDQIRRLCNKVLWIHKGKQILFGETATICDMYQEFSSGNMTLEECQNYYNNSKKFVTKKEMNNLYQKTLGRNPRDAERRQWFLDPETTTDKIRETILASEEYEKLNDKKMALIQEHKQAPLTEEMVCFLYYALLNRPPESSDIVKQMKKNDSFEKLKNAIWNSQEFKKLVMKKLHLK